MACASTIALKLNSHPSDPSGPLRDSSKYTTSPTTTDGTASKVLSTASTAPRPANRATPSQAPSTSPPTLASTNAMALTASDRPTIASNCASKARISFSAVATLSVSELAG